jgi:hypothetical protein
MQARNCHQVSHAGFHQLSTQLITHQRPFAKRQRQQHRALCQRHERLIPLFDDQLAPVAALIQCRCRTYKATQRLPISNGPTLPVKTPFIQATVYRAKANFHRPTLPCTGLFAAPVCREGQRRHQPTPANLLNTQLYLWRFSPVQPDATHGSNHGFIAAGRQRCDLLHQQAGTTSGVDKAQQAAAQCLAPWIRLISP